MPKYIRSRDNPRYKALLKLSNSARARRARDAALLDGPHLIEACSASGRAIDSLIASESGLTKPEIAGLFETTPAQERVILSDRLFNGIAAVTTPTGILGLIKTPDPETWPEGGASCLMLENIQDAGNVGSMLRTAAAAGVRHVALSTGCAFAWSAKVMRAGMGAHFAISIHEQVALDVLAKEFRGQVIATDGRAERTLYEVDLSGPVAWIFGNEGAGISPELMAQADMRVRIPMAAQAESLNVAAAAAVCLFEQARQRAAAGS